jgi:hypothetical protein
MQKEALYGIAHGDPREKLFAELRMSSQGDTGSGEVHTGYIVAE